MAATRILRNAAKAGIKPRDWLIKVLNETGSQYKVSVLIGEAPAAISRAMAEYRIVEVKHYVFKGYTHTVKREWARAEDLLRRNDWQEWG